MHFSLNAIHSHEDTHIFLATPLHRKEYLLSFVLLPRYDTKIYYNVDTPHLVCVCFLVTNATVRIFYTYTPPSFCRIQILYIWRHLVLPTPKHTQ